MKQSTSIKKTVDEKETILLNSTELTDSEKSRRDKIIKVQNLLKDGYSGTDIMKMMSTSARFIRTYKKGNPDELCKNRDYATPKKKELDDYAEYITEWYNRGVNLSRIYREIVSMGCEVGHTCFSEYCEELFHKDSENNFRKNTLGTEIKRVRKPKRHIRRKNVFSYLWGSSKALNSDDLAYVIDKYTVVIELRACIREFRKIFDDKNIVGLFLFIERYKNSHFPKIKTFATGLLSDIEAVINAVSLSYSNGFVEGNNSRLKMIKHTMFGRANLPLLEAKVVM